tara:strand:- start:4215 stop:4739 length:525 start_codon:yes stop_codon:yes gene_type:complete
MNDNDDDVVAEKHRRLNEKKVSIQIPFNDYQRFMEYLDLKYDSDIHGIEQKELEIVSVFKVGLNKLMDNFKTTSSTSFSLNGKRLRVDEAFNISKIVCWFKRQSTFPLFTPRQVECFVKMVLNGRDSRTLTRYYKNICDNSIKNSYDGTYDVTSLYDIIPKGLLIKAGKEIEHG